MAIRKIWEEGGQLPEAEGGAPKITKDGNDSFRELEEAHLRGAKQRAYMEGVGWGAQGGQGERTTATEKLGINLGEIFKAQADLVGKALDKLTDLTTHSSSAAQDPELVRLKEELRAIKELLGKPRSEERTPVQILHEAVSLIDEVGSTFRQRLGVPESTPTGGGDLSLLIELEKVRQEGTDRRQQFEQDMEERRHNWAREQQRWEEEFRLKRLQFFDGQRSRQQATDAIQDLAGALIDGIEEERERETSVQGQPGATPVARRPTRRPKAFRCQDCNGTVRVPSPDTKEVTCEACGAVYSLESKA